MLLNCLSKIVSFIVRAAPCPPPASLTGLRQVMNFIFSILERCSRGFFFNMNFPRMRISKTSFVSVCFSIKSMNFFFRFFVWLQKSFNIFYFLFYFLKFSLVFFSCCAKGNFRQQFVFVIRKRFFVIRE